MSAARYPSKAIVDRYLRVAKEHGIKTPGFRVDPSSGAIEVFESANGESASSAYDRWKARDAA